MLKKAGFVAATAVGLMMVGGTAMASTTVSEAPATPAAATAATPDPTFGDAVILFTEGGGALGYGAAALVAGAYTGIATTPALIAHSLGH